MNLTEFSVVQLREMLRRCNVKTVGNKNELIVRLHELDDEVVAKVIDEIGSEWNAKKSAVEEDDVDDAIKVTTQVAELQKIVEQLTLQLNAYRTSEPNVLPCTSTTQSVVTSSTQLREMAPIQATLTLPQPISLQHDALLFSQANGQFVTNTTPGFAPQLGLPLTSQTSSIMMPTYVSHSHTIGRPTVVPPYISQLNQMTHHAPPYATLSSHDPPPSVTSHHFVQHHANPPVSAPVARSCMNVSDIIAILPKYDPLKGDITAEQFITRIEQLRGVYGWDDRLLLFATQVNLLGVAKTWVDGYPNVFLNWTHFVQEFCRQFPTIVDVADTHMQLIKMHRATDEDVEAYYYRMVATARRGGVDEQSIVKYIITGLNDNDMKRSISVCNYVSIYDLLVAIKNYKKYNSPIKTLKPSFVKQPTPMPQKNDSKSRNSASNIVCYNCRKVGHLSRDCPEPQKRERCTKCNKYGHTDAHCPSRNDVVCNKINGSIYKQIKVNEIRSDAMVDSGSARSLVRDSFAKSLGPRSECSIVLRGFGGGQYRCHEEVLVDLRMDEVNCRKKLLVVPDEMLECEVLLGGDILCSEGNILLISGDQCMMQKIEESNNTSTAGFELQEVLKKHSSRFSTNAMTLGKCNVVKMKIQLTSSVPINLKPYRPPFARRPIMRQQIDDLLKSGIISPSSSPYASPALLVPKKGALYNFSAMHEVHTDASSIGVAAVLLQSTDNKTWHPVMYYSRHCSEAESRYHSYELELMAIVEALQRFRVYLLGKPFKVITDCSAISTMKAKTPMLPRVSRWWLKLSEYDYNCEHRAGSKMQHVDALSRVPNEENGPDVHAVVANISVSDDDWIYTMQWQDPKLRQIIEVLKGLRKCDQEKHLRKEYNLINHRLYRHLNGENLLVIPKAVRWRVTQYCHDQMGHFGIENTCKRIMAHFWFPRIRKYAKDYISACVECCYNKSKTGMPEGIMYAEPMEPVPFRLIHIDHLGPFVKSKHGHTHLVVFSDAFTKYLVIKPVRNTKTLPVITALNELSGYFGLPTTIVTDRGTAFTSSQFAKYCETNTIRHIKTAVRTPRANGQVERANQTILNYIRTSTDNAREWDENVREMQWCINSQPNHTTKFTPNELVFDFPQRDVVQNKLLAAVIQGDDRMDIKEKRTMAIENISSERAKWKARFDRKHSTPQIYNEGDLVVLRHEPVATGDSRKLEPKFRGPYVVSKVLGKDRYLITDMEGMQLTQKKFESVYSSGNIKRWCVSPPDLDENVDDDDIANAEDEDET